MAEVLGIPEIAAVSPFSDPEAGAEQDAALRDKISAWFAQRTGDEIHARARESGLAMSPVMTIEALTRSPQLNERDFFAVDERPGGGRMRTPKRLWVSSDHGWRHGPAPALGQANEEILSDRLGYGADGMARLRAQGAI